MSIVEASNGRRYRRNTGETPSICKRTSVNIQLEIDLFNWPAIRRNVHTHARLPLHRIIPREGRLVAMSPAVNSNCLLRKLARKKPEERQWYGPHDFISIVTTREIDVNNTDQSLQYTARFIKAYFEGHNPNAAMVNFDGFGARSNVPENSREQIANVS